MNVTQVLRRRRDGGRHTREEIEFLVRGAVDGSIPDYQLTAWLMAAFLNPLDTQETAWLTLAMADSGERLDLSSLPKPWVDKHSTGGVGDKTSLVLLPLLAACGLTVVKMSGRGLGITGGTVDKLSSVPGFRTDLSPVEMLRQAARIGIAHTGQTPDLAPADKVLYALRDATATVESVPLIVSSILSKKLAGGAETVVLDVKCGSGAFMPTLERGRELAVALKQAAEACGLKTRIALTDMETPLGAAVGNALEVTEAWSVLAGGPLGKPSSRFQELCLDLAGLTLAACGAATDLSAGRERAAVVLSSGGALAKAREWFAAQRAAEDALDHPERLPRAPVQIPVVAPGNAFLAGVEAGAIGQAVVELGGGRRKKTDVIDASVGMWFNAGVGEKPEAGAPVCTVHAADASTASAAADAVGRAIRWSVEPVPESRALLDLV